ncbi:MAG: F0F1 ATP synthase subunit A [Thermaerobacter sp.]|nr:F0F1 ATP synthase subunit A [Thermaerobacter sp.]
MEPQLQWNVFGFVVNADTMIFSWVSMVIVFILFRLAARKASVERPKGVQNVIELAFEFVNGFIRENVNDEQGRRIFRLLVSLLLYLLVVNIFSLLPFPFMHAAAADFNQTLALATIVFVLIHAYGIVYRGARGHAKNFTLPLWPLTPINMMEAITNPLTLAMRLFGNIFAGDLLMGIAGGIVPATAAISVGFGVAFVASVVIQVAVLGFNTFIAIVQSYIFMMLTLAYVSQSMKPVGEH